MTLQLSINPSRLHFTQSMEHKTTKVDSVASCIPSWMHPNPLQVTAELFDTATATASSSPVSVALDPHGEAPIQHLNNFLPEGHFVQLISSDQVPRYTKNITMQVRWYQWDYYSIG